MRGFIVCVIVLAATLNPTFAQAAPRAQGTEVDVTGEGAVSASTVYEGFPAAFGVDGDSTTSWFSTGPEPNDAPTIFRWIGGREGKITTIFIHSNGENEVPEFRTNFGFGSLTVRVRDAADKVVFQQSVELPGTPDPDVTVHPNVVGHIVELLYTGHEAQDCGGFSELQIKVDRTGSGQAASPANPPANTTAASSIVPPAAIVTDDFDRADSDRCELGAPNDIGGRGLFYLPIFPAGATEPVAPIGANIVSGALQNNGLDYGGVQFTESPTPCVGHRGAHRGTDMGQDLNIRADFLLPTDAAGLITQAGPYVRSRAAATGDGIIGGESAGYWVQLESTGEVKVKRLNPNAIVAFSGKPATFDTTASHTLEIAAGGDRLQVALDGKLQTFDQDGQLVTAVSIPATAGANDGSAGIAFAAEPNRGQIGGQRADNIIVTAYRPLDGLPVQNNFGGAGDATVSVTEVVPTPDAAATSISVSTATPVAGEATVTASGTAVAAGGALAGDCDDDGRLSELDALCALEMSVGLRESSTQMDVDGDATVSSRDAVVILRRVVGQ